MKKTIEVKLGMSRANTGEDSYMRMEIEDASSGIRFVELEIPMEAFAYLVSGLHGIDAKCELHNIENVGTQQEHKTEVITIPKDMPCKVDDNPELIEDLLSPYEVDGWKAYVSDLFNIHNRTRDINGDFRQKVSFHRFVKVEVTDLIISKDG